VSDVPEGFALNPQFGKNAKILVSDVPEGFALNPQFGKNARHSKFLPVA